MITYPTLYDIQQILASQKRSFLSLFAQKRGLFLINASKEDLINEISSHLLELSDLEEIRDALFQSTNKQALSGFLVKPSNTDFDLGSLYSRLREYGSLQTKGYSLEALTRVVEKGKTIYHGKISYTKHKLCRIELMQDEKYDTSFSFFEREDGSWQVEVDGNNSSDGKEVMKLIQMVVKTNPVEINSLKIDNLLIEQVITFFDKLAKEGFDKKVWELVDIRALTFRRRNTSSNIEEEDNIDDVEDVGEEDLGGISQAVLAGRNLREHSFVKGAEKSGCIFTSMTYEFKATKSSEFIIIKAEFKGNPKIFEVSIISTGKIEGISKRKVIDQTISATYRRDKASEFWNKAHNIYTDLIG